MVDFTLTDEQRSMREMAHDFAAKEIRPVAWEYDRDGTWPQDDHREGLGARPDEQPPPGRVRRPGPGLSRRGDHRGGDRLGLLGHRHLAVLQRPGHRADHPGRLRRAQEGVPGPSGRGPAAGLVLSHRARRRLRRLGHEDHGHPQGRQVGHQRLQVLHHQRRVRQLLHRLRQDRQGGRPPRHLLLHRPARRRRRRRQARGQDGSAGLQHGHDHLPRGRDPARPPRR